MYISSARLGEMYLEQWPLGDGIIWIFLSFVFCYVIFFSKFAMCQVGRNAAGEEVSLSLRDDVWNSQVVWLTGHILKKHRGILLTDLNITFGFVRRKPQPFSGASTFPNPVTSGGKVGVITQVMPQSPPATAISLAWRKGLVCDTGEPWLLILPLSLRQIISKPHFTRLQYGSKLFSAGLL